jgi:hypothetical protein
MRKKSVTASKELWKKIHKRDFSLIQKSAIDGIFRKMLVYAGLFGYQQGVIRNIGV